MFRNRPVMLIHCALFLAMTLCSNTVSAADSEKDPARREKLKQAHLLTGQANKLRFDGKLPEALESAQKVLAIYDELYGRSTKIQREQTQLQVNTHRLIALIHEDAGDFASARKKREEVLRLETKLHSKESWQVVDARIARNNVEVLAKLNPKERLKLREAVKVERSARANELLSKTARALELRKEVLGERHRAVIDTQLHLAWQYFSRGDGPKAEALFRQVLAARQELLGTKHPQCADTLCGLSASLVEQGELVKARVPLQQALALRKEVQGDKSVIYANTLRQLSVIYIRQGEFAKAEEVLKEVLALHKKHKGDKTDGYALALYNLSQLYWKKGDLEQAEEYTLKTLALRKELRGDKNIDYNNTLHLLGLVYLAQRNLAKAEPTLQESLAGRKKVQGEKHPEYARNLHDVAQVYELKKQYDDAEPLYRQANEIILEHLENWADNQAEEAQLALANSWRHFLHSYMRNLVESSTPPAKGYALLLSWKGAITARQRVARLVRTTKNADRETLRVFEELEKVSSELSRLAMQGDSRDAKSEEGESEPASEEVDLPKKIQQLTAQREQLEVELSKRTAEFRRFHESRTLTPAGLQKLLPEGTVLVDFLEYGRGKERRLLAFVVSKDSVKLVALGESASTAKTIDAFRASVARRTQAVTSKDDPALLLRDLIWKPLEKDLAGANLVLISPDGPLSQLPFAALPGKDEGKFLLEEMSLVVLPVPRMLPELLAPRSPERDKTPPSLLALGDVDFDANSPSKQPAETEEGTWKRRRAGEPMKWPRLPGTRGEVLAIEETFRKAVPKGKMTALRDKDATESALRKLAPQHEYLHLATHGFFAPREIRAVRQNDDDDTRGGAEMAVTGHHPGLLSGIALAGANKPAEDDDGVLTALEVAEMDLSKVELAVLSACETGLGEVAGGEGVLGLQRAFQVAGARSTVTSFWKVDDQATRNLMERFYDNYWKKGMGAQEAIRDAQLVMLREGVKRGMVREEEGLKKESRTPPYYWAAFVLSGDWR